MPAPKNPSKRAAWIAKIKAYNATRELSPQAVENMRAGGRKRAKELAALWKNATPEYKAAAQAKATITRREKYGSAMMSERGSIDKKRKTRETNIERYGHVGAHGDPEVLAKYRATCTERFGVPSPMQSSAILKKGCETTHAKYGVDYYTQSQHSHDRLIASREKRMKRIVAEAAPLVEQGLSVNAMQPIIGIPYSTLERYLADSGVHVSGRTTLPEQLALDLLESAIPDHEIIQHDRSVLGHLELDLYVPDLKLAMEVNGIYWHSDKFKDRDYHVDKFNACNKKGVRLIQVWDYELDDLRKVDILKSILRCAAGTSDSIGARETELIRINGASPRVDTFLDANHWEGHAPMADQCVTYALCSHNNIVQMMVLEPRGKDVWEVPRSCSKLGVSVTGGTSRLINAFQSYAGHGKLISHSDNRLFSGHSYRAAGFAATGCEVGYDWWHVNTDEFVCQRAAGHDPRQLLGESFDPNLSEIANMHNAGWLRLWDAGRTRWELTF